MKKLIAAVGMLAVLGSGVALAAGKCDTCHKGDKAVDKIVKAKNIDTCAKLLDDLRKGPKAGIHKKLTDDEIKAECKALGLK